MTASPPTDAAPPGVAGPTGGPPGEPPLRPGSHRAQRSPYALVVPTLVVAVSVVAVGVGVYGWVDALDRSQSAAEVSSVAAAPTTTPTAPDPVPSATPEPTKSPKPSPSPKASKSPKASTSSAPAPPVARDYPVVVLNQTSVTGLAAATAADLRRAGWTVTGVGNWRGELTETTVYYPPGLERQATRLAKDLGADRLRPRSSPMRTDRLTVILAGRTG